MPEDKCKYRLSALVSDLLPPKNTEWVIEQLEKNGIKRRTFFRDKSLLTHDEADIPAERLLVYSKFFDVPIDELYNYSIRIKPAKDRKVA